MTTQMIVRIDEVTKSKVDMLAKNEGKSTSRVVRELLEGYIKDRDIGSYIDELWERTGRKMKTKGVKITDIKRTIQAVRKTHAKSRH